MQEFFFIIPPLAKHIEFDNNRTPYLEESIHVVFEETQNKKNVEILNDINESVHHLSVNDKNPLEANNEGIYKDQANNKIWYVTLYLYMNQDM